jgi:hypothetical protein
VTAALLAGVSGCQYISGFTELDDMELELVIPDSAIGSGGTSGNTVGASTTGANTGAGAGEGATSGGAGGTVGSGGAHAGGMGGSGGGAHGGGIGGSAAAGGAGGAGDAGGAGGTACTSSSCHPFDACDDSGGAPICDTTKVIFLTSAEYQGNLGGLDGADAKCASAAAAAFLPGTFAALLADSTGSPATRHRQAGAPYVLPDGVTVVAADWYALMNDDLDHAVGVDEHGTVFDTDPLVDSSNDPWANIALGGTFASATSADAGIGSGHCIDWTTKSSSLSESGDIGDITTASPDWMGRRFFRCHVPHRLICVQQ